MTKEWKNKKEEKMIRLEPRLPPDEIHRGVEIVVDILVVVGGGGSRKRLW